jgi:DNA-binding GntR family transcriptional regulator
MRKAVSRPVVRRSRSSSKIVHVGSLADEAYIRLKRQIIRCEMPPDLLVTESQLVRESGLGKTPVREALYRLVQEGLVRNIPRHGYEIAPITLGDVEELFGLRLIVEPHAAELAAGRVDAAQLRQLDELCATADPNASPEALDRHMKANRDLHVAIARSAGNRRLADVVERLMDESERVLRLGMLFRDQWAQIVHEHQQLIEALIEGDSETARRVSTEQIVAARTNVTAALLASPAILSAHVTAPQAARRRA